MAANYPVDELGVVGRVSVSIAVTDEPWTLDIDTIVLSVGTGLGRLAEDVMSVFPRAPWRSVNLGGVTPEQPYLLPLKDGAPESRLQLAVLTSPHDGGGPGEVSLGSVSTATRAAVLFAASSGATAVGVPLLATGVLGADPKQIAQVAIPAALEGATVPGWHVRRLIFICIDQEAASAIRSALTSQASLGDGFPAAQPDTGATSGNAPLVRPAAAFSDTELAGGMSSDLVDPNKGIPLSDDHLDVTPYVSMLATVIADKATPLPLSVGIFGEWGSGKSYFMGLLRQRIKDLASTENPAYCKRIEQIGFNAWHYADSNLWASLGDEIFRQLAEPESDTAEQRETLRTALAARLTERRRLEAATEQARIEVTALQASVDTAVANREASAGQLITALRESDEARKAVDELWHRLGVNDEIEQGKLFVEQFRGTLTEAEALRRAPWNRRGNIALAAAAMLLVTGGLAALLTPFATEWLVGIGGVISALVSGGIAALTAARSGLRKLRELSESLHNRMERAAEEAAPPDDAVTKLEALRRAEAEQRIAEAQLSEVVSRVGELGRQLAELTPGRRLYSFLADRARGDSYSRNLGLISMIHKDFQQLVALMKDWRENGESADDGARQSVERIVLYIDDLDRCSPRQVVDVLQAVHLLLAMELFVVVVGVDPRWLLCSLSSHFDEILSGDRGAVDAWQAMPEDYLEKILNLPIVLPRMSAGSLNQLLRSMVEAGGEAPTQAPTTDDGTDPTKAAVDSVKRLAQKRANPNTMTVEAGSEVDAQQHDSAQPRRIPRPLTDAEIDLLGSLDLMVATPREAKRLINLYRMLRATRDLSEASRFLGKDGKPGDYQAVVVLLGLLTAHARLLGRVLDTPPDPDNGVLGGLIHRPETTSWSSFVSDFKPERSNGDWTNRIVGLLANDDVPHWVRLHCGLTRLSGKVTLTNLANFQLWVPRIRRFSYVLSPPTGS